MNKSQVWLKAFRLRTLPLALSCIAMGGFLASAAGAFRWSIFLLCVATTIFLQILSNLANDYGDVTHRADSADRKGPARAEESGGSRAAQIKGAVSLFVLPARVSHVTLFLVWFGLAGSALLF